jgi:hypothetical protein
MAGAEQDMGDTDAEETSEPEIGTKLVPPFGSQVNVVLREIYISTDTD